MRYIVFSDSHGRTGAMEEILEKERFDGIIHLGDGYEDAGRIEGKYPYKAFIRVTGNCDGFFYGTTGEQEAIASIDGIPVLVCHGHKYGVKLGTEMLLSSAREKNVKAALFGHTHRQFNKKKSGILLLNPGSVGERGEYAVIEASNGIISAELKHN